MAVTEQHLHHIAKRHESLSKRYEGLKAKGAKLTGRLVRSGEVVAGAALAGVLQGMSKNPAGPRIAHVPADLAIGLGLEVVAAFDIFGDEWSHHAGNFGTGFLAAYFTEAGFAVGKRKRDSGTFFAGKVTAPLAAPAAAAAAVHGDATAQAEQLLRQMQARQG
jgi:hypothetical protein